MSRSKHEYWVGKYGISFTNSHIGIKDEMGAEKIEDFETAIWHQRQSQVNAW